jgi:HAD superfamily hydrolase (TIGR01509 family)
MLKAILFDLDDTLIDWGDFFGQWDAVERMYIGGVYEYIRAQGHDIGDLDSFRELYFERTVAAWDDARTTLIAPHLGRILVETAAIVGVPEADRDTDALLNAYGWRAVRGTAPFPDAIDSLRMLREQGLKLGLVTNAFQPMRLRDREIEEHGLLEFFPDCRISAADVGYLKPHPEIFTQALDLLEVSADEAIFIGDNPVADIAGAQAAGMRAVMRVTEKLKPLLSGLIIPDAAVNTLEELPAVLDEWYPNWRSVEPA